jgi:leader peptidase (prepilin peptidase)/N-methyltransferase
VNWVLVVVIAAIAVGGLAVGWWSAWLAHSYTEDEESETAVFAPASCDECGTVISRSPVGILTAFRCTNCRHRLPAMWWLATLAVPIFGLGMLATWDTTSILIAYLWLVPVLVTASVVDLRLLLIPKRIAWIGFLVGAALVVAVSLERGLTSAITNALIGATGYFFLLFIIWFIAPRGMGFGDVRLAAVLGLYLGWIDLVLVPVGLFIACVVGLVMGLSMRIVTKERHFPFGPALAAGALITIWFWEFWQDLLIPSG